MAIDGSSEHHLVFGDLYARGSLCGGYRLCDSCRCFWVQAARPEAQLCRGDLNGAISETEHREVGAGHVVGGENADGGANLGGKRRR